MLQVRGKNVLGSTMWGWGWELSNCDDGTVMVAPVRKYYLIGTDDSTESHRLSGDEGAPNLIINFHINDNLLGINT